MCWLVIDNDFLTFFALKGTCTIMLNERRSTQNKKNNTNKVASADSINKRRITI